MARGWWRQRRTTDARRADGRGTDDGGARDDGRLTDEDGRQTTDGRPTDGRLTRDDGQVTTDAGARTRAARLTTQSARSTAHKAHRRARHAGRRRRRRLLRRLPLVTIARLDIFQCDGKAAKQYPTCRSGNGTIWIADDWIAGCAWLPTADSLPLSSAWWIGTTSVIKYLESAAANFLSLFVAFWNWTGLGIQHCVSRDSSAEFLVNFSLGNAG